MRSKLHKESAYNHWHIPDKSLTMAVARNAQFHEHQCLWLLKNSNSFKACTWFNRKAPRVAWLHGIDGSSVWHDWLCLCSTQYCPRLLDFNTCNASKCIPVLATLLYCLATWRFHFRTTAARLNPSGCRAIYHQSIRIQNIMTSQNLLQEKLHHSQLYRLSRHIKTLGWPVVSDLEEHSCTLRPGPTGWQTSSE